MNLAQTAWEDGRVPMVLGLLDRYRPQPGQEDLRGFEWYYWNRLCHSELLALKGHKSEVTCVAFSPDGKRLASASPDDTVKVWDAATGQEILALREGGRSVAFSPDGKWLVSGIWSNRPVKVWDADTGRESLTLQGPTMKGATGPVDRVMFSPDGRRIAATINGYGTYPESHPDELWGGVTVWDGATGHEVLTWKGHTNWVTSIAFSPDGKRLASASGDQTLKVWDAATGAETLTLKRDACWVNSVAFSPDGRRLASADDQAVKVWDAHTGKETLTLKGAHGKVAFSPDGKRLAAAGRDNTLKVWDAATGAETLAFQGHESSPNVAFTADGRRLAFVGTDSTVNVCDARDVTPELPTEREATGGPDYTERKVR